MKERKVKLVSFTRPFLQNPKLIPAFLSLVKPQKCPNRKSGPIFTKIKRLNQYENETFDQNYILIFRIPHYNRVSFFKETIYEELRFRTNLRIKFKHLVSCSATSYKLRLGIFYNNFASLYVIYIIICI